MGTTPQVQGRLEPQLLKISFSNHEIDVEPVQESMGQPITYENFAWKNQQTGICIYLLRKQDIL
jgi:hypothetical protein